MNNQHKAKVERHRASEMFAKQIADISIDGGDIRFFASSVLVASVKLCAELEGDDQAARQLRRIAEMLDASSDKKH